MDRRLELSELLLKNKKILDELSINEKAIHDLEDLMEKESKFPNVQEMVDFVRMRLMEHWPDLKIKVQLLDAALGRAVLILEE